ncbi:MAG: FAD-dependent oxidoreductase, partial [Lentisphaeria bacterium]|nr:FAD-dependent oxidoreductase [Lentisphaeria bacterium]
MEKDAVKKYDVIVIGGGAAGVAAAIRAGRDGVRCALIEKNGIPGGTITACGIAAPGLFAVNGKQIISGIGWELVCKALAETGTPPPDLSRWDEVFWRNQIDINPVIFSAVCDQELLAANVDIHYHTMLGALKDEG